MKRQRQSKRMWTWTSVMAGLVLGTALWATAQEKKTDAPQALEVTGSTTVGPIAEAFAEALTKSHGLKITVKSPGSGVGATALIEGRCQIATMSRFMKPEEFKQAAQKGVMATAHAVAMDGVVVVVHPSNPLKNLSLAQIKDLYTGKTTNWKDLGGPDKPIVVISRDTSSGTYESFTHFVMGKDKMSDKVEYVTATTNARDRVATTEGAIAYIGVGFVDPKVKALSVNDVAANKKTILSGKYPLARPLFLFTNGFPDVGSPAYTFCTFHLTEKGQEIIQAQGFIPFTNY